jgi:phage FluMu gp28-like protein
LDRDADQHWIGMPISIGSGCRSALDRDTDQPLTFLAIELRNVPFAQQWQTVLYIMNELPNFGGGAYDARGNGQMIAELAAQEWPGYVEMVMITVKWYAENFPKLKGSMEDDDTNIPDDYFIREDFRVVGLKAGVPCVLERSGARTAARGRRDRKAHGVLRLHAGRREGLPAHDIRGGTDRKPLPSRRQRYMERVKNGLNEEQAVSIQYTNRHPAAKPHCGFASAIFLFCAASRRNAPLQF